MLLEAIRVFIDATFSSPHTQSDEEWEKTPEKLQALHRADNILSRSTLYEILSQEEGRDLALLALALGERDDVDDTFRFMPHMVLNYIADAVPGALMGLYPRLLQRNFAYGTSSLFREADAAIYEQLIAWIESEEQSPYSPQELLALVAWINNEAVTARFNQWRNEHPLWIENLPMAIEWFSFIAGWELTDEGQRRELYYPMCWNLLPSPKGDSEPRSQPIEMILPHEGYCSWCQQSMVTLFDLHLQDSQLRFLGLQGERLRIALCPNCTIQDYQIITDVDLRGGSRWSFLSGERPRRLRLYKNEKLEEMALPQSPLVLGATRRTPFISEGSHLGGCPGWIQNPEYPQCPQCQQTMTFIGQYEPYQVDYIEGIIYAFLCKKCLKATTVYQQT